MQNFKRGRSRGYNSNGRSSYGGGHNRANGGQRHRNKGESLNPMLFVRKAELIEEAPYEPTHLFLDMPLDRRVQENLVKRGFTQPTPIQDKSILPIMEGRDLVGIADTGTGKTAAFLLPLITKIAQDRSQRVLIVTPTRELAEQIQEELKNFNRGMDMYSALCIGGASINVQSKHLSRRPHFVIGTPGRLMDLEKRRILDMRQFNNVVLDEVDRMLDMGFIRDIKHIISLLPTDRQSLFFSATMPEKTKAVMHSLMRDHVTVSIKTADTSQNVDQDIIRVDGKDKVELLHDLLIQEGMGKVLVFGRTKHGVNKLEQKLRTRGFKVASIHGNKSQAQRSKALQKLKESEVQILLATDVVARGIDIDDVTHVINFDVPESYEDYVHRIGRTGRAGKKGIALTFVN